MKKILFLLLIILIYSLCFSKIINDKTYLYKQLYYGNNYINITPYPKTSKKEISITQNYLYFNTNPFWIIYGKYKTNWSDLEHGVYLSDSLPYVNGLMGGYDTKTLKMIFGVYSFNPELSIEQEELQKIGNIDQNSDRTDFEGYTSKYKTLIIHRLELKPFEFIRVSFNELNLVGGKLPDIVDINPMGILHNTYGEGFSNAMLGLDFSFIPLKGYQLYGQFAMDDYMVPETEAGAENYKPTAFAYGFGSRYIFKLNNLLISPKIEYYKVYTWMYNRWQELLKFTGKYNGVEFPMGFKYGNDIEGYLLGTDILSKNFNLKLLFELYKKGEIDLNTPYDDPRKPESDKWEGPYGTTKKFITISIFFELK